ncbi:hypothetical protein NPIL_506741 [Nephila pilipes]|uniref:Uncharacterized protein n=1 Tax=Nephila pilipes TaxID=299642 RepID=A0A8X6QAU3_NEPPI|nr:hypothetical protein NPIL_506741 [Nephila pilipes]
MSDTLSDGVTAQTEGEIKEEDVAVASEALEPVISRDNPVVIVDNGVPKKEELDDAENNNELTALNQNFVAMSPEPEPLPRVDETPLQPKEAARSTENEQAVNKISSLKRTNFPQKKLRKLPNAFTPAKQGGPLHKPTVTYNCHSNPSPPFHSSKNLSP